MFCRARAGSGAIGAAHLPNLQNLLEYPPGLGDNPPPTWIAGVAQG